MSEKVRLDALLVQRGLVESRDTVSYTHLAINEAVELSKQFELGESAAFINGVLGGIARGSQQ